MYLNIILLFILGLIMGSFFVKIGLRLPVKMPIYTKSICLNCEHELRFIEKIPIISYIIQKGKCNYCKEKISGIYLLFELLTGLLFPLIYLIYIDSLFPFIYSLFGIVIISSLIIVMVSDIKYMIIPNEVIIFFSIIVVILKIYISFINDELASFIDIGYELIFMLKDAIIMFIIMYLIKKIGDLIFKRASLGGGDVKLMVYISLFMGYKLCIIIIFLASFIALPISIINIHKKNEQMLPFGPYLAIATSVLFLSSIDFNTIIDFIH